jgi:hypothetical protein
MGSRLGFWVPGSGFRVEQIPSTYCKFHPEPSGPTSINPPSATRINHLQTPTQKQIQKLVIAN